MAIKPILFNTEMVRAILDGRKTCTRRLVRFLPGENPQWAGYIRDGLMLYNGKNEPCIRKAPYQPGDILYVRETWCKNPNYDEYYFRTRESGIAPYGLKWHASIHMPKEAARIWLKVTDVRVERLQEIAETGIRKEGVDVDPKECAGKFDFTSELFFLFQRLWDSTIKKSDIDRYGWDANPWVWVISFERCEKPKGV